MATVQIRDVPDDTYDVLRRRARQAGQSLQSYMRAQLIQMAAQQTKEEAIASISAIQSRPGFRGISVAEILHDLDELRGRDIDI